MSYKILCKQSWEEKKSYIENSKTFGEVLCHFQVALVVTELLFVKLCGWEMLAR